MMLRGRKSAWKLGILCALLALGATQCSQDGSSPDASGTRPDSAPQIINAFQNSCPGTIGAWTQTALAHTQALQAMFQNLAKDHPCRQLESQILSIQQYSASMEKILADKDFDDLKTKEMNLRNLTAAYLETPPDDPNDLNAHPKADLRNAITQLQIDIAQARAQFATDQNADRRARYQTFANGLTDYTQKIVQNADQLDACLKESPEVAIQLASNLIAVGGSLVSPIVGAGAQIISAAIGDAITMAQVDMPVTANWELYQAQLPTALTCGLEAMTEFYCQANETFDIATAIDQTQDPAHPSQPSPIRDDLKLYSDRLPLLVSWLRELRNGLPPSDKYDFDRQKAAVDVRNAVESEESKVEADLSTMNRLYAQTTDQGARDSLLVNFVRDASVDAVGTSSPFEHRDGALGMLTSDPRQMACWIVRDFKDTTKCDHLDPVQMDSSIVENYIKAELLQDLRANVARLSINWEDTVAAAMKRAEAGVQDAKSYDVRGLMQKARECNAKDPCARSILESIRTFLTEMKKRPNLQPGRLETISNTMDIIDRAIALIDVPDPAPTQTAGRGSTPDPDLGVRQQIGELYDLFQLRNGTGIFAQRVGDLIQYDLNDRLAAGEIKDDLGDILNSLGGDLRMRLLGGKSDDPLALLNDLNHARGDTSDNIAAFTKAFAPALGFTVDSLSKKAMPPYELPTGPNRPFGQQLGQLCSLILSSTPSDSLWPDAVSWPICQQASYYYASYPGNEALTLSFKVGDQRQELASATRPEDQTLMHRMCEYHRFVRSVKIREAYNELAKEQKPGQTAAVRLHPELLGRSLGPSEK